MQETNVQNTPSCPFCPIEVERIILQNEFGFVVRDGFPVSEGHSLIIPKRHVSSFFDLSQEEQHALLELLNQCKRDLSHISLCSPASLYRHPEASNRHSGLDPESSTSQSEVKVPSSFNIGINDGAAAGQTVPHCHIHLIPRYKGDVEDPRGGVRWVLAEKADYWSDSNVD